MPRYDYQCSDCGNIEEHFLSINDLDKIVVLCKKCNNNLSSPMIRLISSSNITPDYKPWVDENMNKDGSPVYIKSRRHHKEELKKRRLVQIG